MSLLVVLVPDLFFGVRIHETARALGYQTRDAGNTAALRAAVQDAHGVIIDTQQPDWETLVETLNQLAPAVPVLAFVPHVAVDTARRALALGVKHVVTRGAFARDMADWLHKLAAQAASS